MLLGSSIMSCRSTIKCGAFESGSSKCKSKSNLYGVLGVSSTANMKEIKQSYWKLALSYHPDVCPVEEKDECSQKFIQIQQAYQVLYDPQLRADYDHQLQFPLAAGVVGDFNWESQIRGMRRRRHKDGSWAAAVRQKSRSP